MAVATSTGRFGWRFNITTVFPSSPMGTRNVAFVPKAESKIEQRL
jgi:hypothetical protein